LEKISKYFLLLQLTLQEDRFLLFNLALGPPTLPAGPAVYQAWGDDDGDDAASVSSVSSQSSVASDVAGPSHAKKKKKMAGKQVMMIFFTAKPAAFGYFWPWS
jgi:hypothetical protein